MISNLINFHYLIWLRVIEVLYILFYYKVYIVSIYHSTYITHRYCISTMVKRLSSPNHLGCDLEKNLKIFIRIQRAHGSVHVFGIRESGPP